MHRAFLVLSGLLVSASLAAGSLHVVVDAERLDDASVDPVFLLPDGSQLAWQAVVSACMPLQGDGLLAYDPDSGACVEFGVALPGESPDYFDMQQGAAVFDARTRISCLPGQCVVTVDGAPAGSDPDPDDPSDSVFADGFKLLLPQS